METFKKHRLKFAQSLNNNYQRNGTFEIVTKCHIQYITKCQINQICSRLW